MTRSVLLLLFASSLLTIGCSRKQDAADSRIHVIASIVPMGDIADQIAGSAVRVTVVVPAGSNPHTFDLTPEVLRSAKDARIFFRVGGGLEFWSDKLRDNIFSKHCELVTALDPPMPVRIDGFDVQRLTGDFQHDHGEGNAELQENPHFWLDPIRVIEVVRRLRDALVRADAANAPVFTENARRFIDSLRALHREIDAETSGWRVKSFVAQHASWDYFAMRYGLRQLDVLEKIPGREISPKELATVIKRMATDSSAVIFAETVSSTKAAESLAAETGARMLLLDPIGGSRPGENYLQFMRSTVREMAEAMR